MRIFGALSIVLIAGVQTEVFARERLTVELRPEEGVICSELRVTRPWAVPRYDPAADYPGLDSKGFNRPGAQFEFRQGERLLIGVSSLPQVRRPPIYSPDVYAIIPQKGKLTLASTNANEWNAARVLPHSTKPASGEVEKGKPLSYAGRTFAFSGKHWWSGIDESTRISADKAYLALFTWDGTVDWGTAFVDTGRFDGRYFVDLYHVPSGRRTAVVQGRFQEVSPGALFDNSFWIERSRFVMPIEERMQRLVICEAQ